MVFPLQHCSHLAKRIEVILSCPSTPQPRCAPTASSPEPDAAQSAILKRGWQKEDLVVLVGAAFQEQGVFGLSHLLRDGCAVSERACQTGKGRDNKLVTEDSKPVGSVRWLSAQVPAGFARRSRMRTLDHRFSSCLPKPRCQQALSVDRGCDLFGSAREPTQEMILPPGGVRPCLDPLFI